MCEKLNVYLFHYTVIGVKMYQKKKYNVTPVVRLDSVGE